MSEAAPGPFGSTLITINPCESTRSRQTRSQRNRIEFQAIALEHCDSRARIAAHDFGRECLAARHNDVRVAIFGKTLVGGNDDLRRQTKPGKAAREYELQTNYGCC